VGDLLVGTPWEGEGEEAREGGAHLFLGGNITSGSVEDADASIRFGSAGTYLKSYLGNALGTGDFDGDGYADLALGAIQPGAVIVSGASVRSGEVEDVATAVVDVDGHSDDLAVGDFTGDGRDDLGVHSDMHGVLLLSGPLSGFLEIPGPEFASVVGGGYSRLGETLASADMNGDGFVDLLVGDYGLTDDAGNQPGAAYLFLGGAD
jgi:hypothetical protein